MAKICLVACARSKASSEMPAKNLYVSSLFRKAKAFASNYFDRWYILSAKYGLVEPEQVIQPYEKTLKKMSRQERKGWAEHVFSSLIKRTAPEDDITFIAGVSYREYLVPSLLERGHRVHVPLEGRPIGMQLKWLKEATQ